MAKLKGMLEDETLRKMHAEYRKENKNPPTYADLAATAAILRAADSFLSATAEKLRCGLAYLGEETVRPAYCEWLAQVLADSIANKVAPPDEFFTGAPNTIRVILDAIDGTANFSKGFPLFCSAIAILVDDQPRIGATYDPIHNVVYSGVLPGPYEDPGQASTAYVWEVAAGNRIDLVAHTSRQEAIPLREQAIAVHLPRGDKDKRRRFLDVLEELASASGAVYAVNAGSVAMANVASGGLGAFLNIHTNAWDVAAGEVLIKACGGLVTGFDGRPVPYDSARHVSVLSTNQSIHSDLLSIVKETVR